LNPRRKDKMKYKLITVALFLLLSVTAFSTIASAYGDRFSCSFGKQAACLDIGDKVGLVKNFV